MAPNIIVLYLGIAIIVLGLGFWALKTPAPTTENTIRFMGFEVVLNTQAFVVMAFGVVLILVSTQLPRGEPTAQTTIAPTKTYRFCTGEYEKACQSHDVYVYCEADINEWARKKCSSYKIVQVTQYGGNKCGYSINDVFCDGPH